VELHELYCFSDVMNVNELRRMRWVADVECMGEKRVAYRVLLGKPEGKRLL
jgi:hypothetical protein